MKVILDVTAITYPLTGIGRYTLALAQGLESSSRIEDVRFFARGKWVNNLDDLVYAENSIFRPKALLRQHLPFRRLIRMGIRYFNAWKFHHQVRNLSDYIYHAPNYDLMPFKGKSVVTIHDLSFIRHSEFHPNERALYWQNEINNVIEYATHVITDSEFQRQEIIELLNVEPSRVSAVHLGVEEKFQTYSEEDSKSVLEQYGLQYKGYSLVVATIEPRKNFERLLHAFELLPEKTRSSYPLVIVGDKGWLSGHVHKTISRLVEKKEALRLGYVDEKNLPKLYAAALIFLYPSLYEGFGLPVLEAMASGTAVLSSNSTSIPEIAGHDCLLVDPYSVDEITQGWRSLLEDKVMRVKLSKSGQKRARNFSWDRCLNKTIDVYEKLNKQ